MTHTPDGARAPGRPPAAAPPVTDDPSGGGGDPAGRDRRDPADRPVAAAPPGEGPGATRRLGTAALAAAVVVGLLLGYLAGLLTPRLTAPGDTSVEAGFARDMSTHHGQAVEMGTIAYQRASLPEVRTIGIDIALTQQAQIGMMSAWLREWGLNPTGPRPPMAWMPDGEQSLTNGLMPGMATQEELAQLREATGEEVDALFLELMLRHHLGGIHMAEAALARTDHPEVVRLAETMKAGQQRDIAAIRAMQDLLGKGG